MKIRWFFFYMVISNVGLSQGGFAEVTQPSDFYSTSHWTFVHVYADWCQICKQVKNNIYLQPEISQILSENYQLKQWNPEKHVSEQAMEWKIRQYPTLLVIDDKGAVFYRYAGMLNKDQMLLTLHKIDSLKGMEMDELTRYKHFPQSDHFLEALKMRDDIMNRIEKPILSQTDIDDISKNLSVLEMDEFKKVCFKLEASYLSFRQKSEIRKAIMNYYTTPGRFRNEDEQYEAERFIKDLRNKIKPLQMK